jgi:phage terminase large subunit
MSVRVGVVLKKLEEWGERDTGVTARRAIDGVGGHKRVFVQYDSIGVGSGVKAETNRLNDDGLLPEGASFASWNAGAAVLHPDRRVEPDDRETPLNKDFYQNLKAQAWWQLRRRFEKTHRCVSDLTGQTRYDQDELISLPSDLPLLRTLQKELSQPTASKGTRMRLVIDKQPEGTRSPNLADAVVMCYWPVDNLAYDTSMEWV